MKETSYIIDKELSLKNGCLALKTQGNVKQIPSKNWIEELKALSLTGKIYFNEKQLALDFYGKADFTIQVEMNENDAVKLLGKLKWSHHEISLQECDFLFQGPPHFFIKGIHLKIIGSNVSWKELLRLQTNEPAFTFSDIKELEMAHADDKLEPAIFYDNATKYKLEQSAEPTPFLVLKDRTGAFADLWINYGDKKKSYHDLLKKTDTEKSFEKDLLETDFIIKQMVNSHYYSPLDKVSKSLTFLLEIGWKIFDYQGKEIIRYSDMDMVLSQTSDTIKVTGSLKYETHLVDLANVVGAFNRKERFVQISQNVVGLLPERFESKGLNELMENAEVVNGAVTLKRQQIGLLKELLDDERIIKDDSLKDLNERLQSFEGVSFAGLTDDFKGILRPYQQEGVNFLKYLYDFRFSGMLADDMGLGKTVQVIAFLTLLNLKNSCLIVLPASLVFNWQLEIQRFAPHFKIAVYHGKTRTETLDLTADIILTTYSTLRMNLSLFTKVNFECLILDEAQNIKNAHTQTAKALFSLNARFKLSITGTPIENHLSELWSHFYFLMPELLGEENTFLADVQAASSDLRYLQKIKKKIRPFILRRKKEEVAKDLPEKIEQTVFVEMEESQRKIYDDYLSGIKNSLIKKIGADGFSKHRMEVLEAILRLRQICCHPLLVTQEAGNFTSAKLESLLEDIETAVAEGRKVLVYSQFTSMLKLIAKALKEKEIKFTYLDGSTTNREKVVSEFQNDATIPLFLISLKAGGVGLNLTAADYVFLFDPWWNDAIENQAINRAHRIGRKDTVFAKRYITLESIEEKMMTLKKNKGQLASDILDDELANVNLTEDDFKFLLT